MNNGKKISRRGALIATGLTVFATPAFASLIVQNYMEADFTVAAACFVKIAGDDTTSYLGTDANDPLATFSAGATNTIQVDGANLLEEKLTIRGMRGDRVTYTDVVRYQNNCDVPLSISLVASTATATGDWTDRSARIYISDQTSPVGGTATKPSGAPGAPASGWNGTPIIVETNGNIPASNAQTGVVTVDPGEEVFGALTISAGIASTAGTGTVNWVAQAANAN